ncbi:MULTISPECIES: hypothetical protein [unclassified Rhizobium]|uniref:hypothetical protein n=1 Tax=unclassified Rhizobium TaxID=2613769 RepID=UPI001E4EABAB|nr:MULTISPECIES: hypothetical protein [unclassified Rhizobium]UJW73373.1 hypothetical protein IM739_10555 [Rhizobium sp. SL42]CAH0340393.1 hypothetical protein RHI9324_02057 [Rhizobium sp. CECT 9324]
MEFGALIGPAVVAAGVSGVITVIGMLVARSTTIGLHREKIESDQVLARQKFEYDKQQAVFKRRFDIAEQFLADAYRFRSLLKYVRNGAAFGDEGSTRVQQGGEEEQIKRLRDTYYVPTERLNTENEFISAFFARRTTCHAHFGPKAEEAFLLLQEALHRVRVSSSLLVKWATDHDQIDRALTEELIADIWEGVGELEKKNRIGTDVDRAVALIEEICRPVLNWVG